MPSYSAGQVKLESGLLNSSVMQNMNRVTNVRIGYNIPRANVTVLNRGKPLEQRPVINYIPVDATIDFYKSDNSIEQMLGLVNPTGIAKAITDTSPATATYGIRSAQVYYAPTTSTNYNGLIDLKSGVLNTYTLQGSINEPMKGTIGLQFLDMSGSVNTTARDTSNYVAGIVKPENVSLTGIQFTGLGLTGVNIQSFSLSVSFSRTSVMQLGSKYPIQRPLTDVQGTLQVQGFIEGLNNSLTGLSPLCAGLPIYGVVGLTMSPSCSTASPSSIIAANPYLDNYDISAQAGNFSTISLSFSFPLGPNPNETGDGSTLILV